MADSIIGKISVGDGATFTPDVTDGVLSFTNNKNLPNPEPYNIAAKVLDEGENELRTLVTAAETAAGNAATSETNAHNSEQAAKASETAAATSASAAKTSETNAASSETAAANSASAAAGSAGAAKTSETNAKTSESNAANSAKAAANSATAAAASAAEVEAALDDYLPLSGGTVTGGLTVEGTITGNLDGNAGTATIAYNDANGNPIASTYLPAVVGAVVAFAGRTTPQGWLLCDGSAVSRTDYAALFAVIGTTYGAGNGSTTFNLPNLVDKFVEGSATAGTIKNAGLPNITGGVQPMWDGSVEAKASMITSGAFYRNKTGNNDWYINGGNYGSNDNGSYEAYLDASRSSSIYGNSNTVQPPALTMRYIIKY